MTDHELVKTCMRLVFKKLGFESTDQIAQRDLEHFCEQVAAETGVLISLSTAKRLLYAQFSKLPQVATLNAIAQFLGYSNWQAFKQEEKTDLSQLNKVEAVTTKKDQSFQKFRSIFFKRKKPITLIASIVAMFFLIA